MNVVKKCARARERVCELASFVDVFFAPRCHWTTRVVADEGSCVISWIVMSNWNLLESFPMWEILFVVFATSLDIVCLRECSHSGGIEA